jgi:hypothetical protein
MAAIARDTPLLELLSSGPYVGAGAVRLGRNACMSSVESMLTVGDGGRQLVSEVTTACLRTLEDAGTGQPVACCTMRAKVAVR